MTVTTFTAVQTKLTILSYTSIGASRLLCISTFQTLYFHIVSCLKYSEKREFATKAGECMPCHSECKVQEGKQTCTGPVGLVPCTAATYRQYCLFFSSAIFCQVHFLPLNFCFSVFCLKREPTSAKLVPGYRTARTACPRVLRAWWEGRRSSLNTPTSRATVSPATLTAHKGQEIWFEGLYFQTGASFFSLHSIFFLNYFRCKGPGIGDCVEASRYNSGYAVPLVLCTLYFLKIPTSL